MSTLTILLTIIIYYGIQSKYHYWKKRGIPGSKPTIFLGNIGETLLMKRSLGEVLTDIYNNYPILPFVGIFISGKPALLVREPEFVKNITVKDFGHFVDNDSFDKKLDPILGRHPFFLKGDEWKQSRALACFTASKMKSIFPLIQENCRQFVDYIRNQEDAFSSKGIEAKSLCLKYTLKNVTSCAFGVESNTFGDPDDEFLYLAKRILHPSTKQAIKAFFLKIFPSLFTILSVKFIPKDVEDKLQNIVSETLNYRAKHSVVRNDFLYTLANIKETHSEFTDMDVTANATLFFGDDYEASSILLSFILYELASNPDAQTKLREELATVFESILSFDDLQQLNYLDAVVTETLRKDPPVFALSKTCTKPYTYQSSSNDGYKNISKKALVHGLQHDAKFYQGPEKFFPERFLGDRKNDLNKYTYLPFGEGPRMCLGLRFGLMQVKAALIHIIKNFIVTLNNKTQVPLKLNPTYPMMSPVGGLWLNFSKVG
ncbi:p450 domain containing protein [Asbolus verrucosus]|uniref:p450 domain containing protein n=1 Tax=Asbolus verrucosus TaxID=1661398 RepID=A0A482W0Q2_ASBVE|nr:p450 domain containing protein [Asbolus verrucosus]